MNAGSADSATVYESESSRQKTSATAYASEKSAAGWILTAATFW